jgi:tetratricopeptide (TPR) repeat protein
MLRSCPHRPWLGWIFLANLCVAQSPSGPGPARASLEEVLQLAKTHRYREAASAIRGVPEPRDPQQRMAFLRLRASIESGLGNSTAAAADMEAAAKLAPDNGQLQAAASLARLEAQVQSHLDPAPPLKTLRAIVLPPAARLELHIRTAELLSHAHLYKEAVVDLSQAARLAPDRPDILYNLALAHYYNGQMDAALESANRAKALEDNASTESLLGDIHEKRGDALEAVHNYQAAVSLDPNNEQHRLALATELLRHQTFKAAIVVLEQAADLFPQSSHVRVLLGLSYYLVDRSADAVHTLLEGTDISNDDDLAIRYLGEITLQDTAAPDPAAVAKICTFADAHPSDKVGNALCGGILLRVSQETGDDSRQEEIFRRLRESVRIAPNESIARCQLGKALDLTQQWTAARTQLEACVRLKPAWPEGHYRLARIYRHLGLKSLALQQTKLHKQVAKDETDESVRRANTVGRFLVLFDR